MSKIGKSALFSLNMLSKLSQGSSFLEKSLKVGHEKNIFQFCWIKWKQENNDLPRVIGNIQQYIMVVSKWGHRYFFHDFLKMILLLILASLVISHCWWWSVIKCKHSANLPQGWQVNSGGHPYYLTYNSETIYENIPTVDLKIVIWVICPYW